MSRKRKSVADWPIQSGEVSAMSHEGRGIVRHEGQTIFIDGVMLGEVINYQITKARRRIFEAKVIEWLKPSEQRVTPDCQHAAICGGCSLQHMAPAQQIKMKQQTLLDQLEQFGQVTPQQLLKPITAETQGYRRKARLGVKYVIKKEKLLIGFREKQSSYLADIEVCTVLHPRLAVLFVPLRHLLAELSIYQAIPQIEAAVGDDKIALVMRHLQPFTEPDKLKLQQFAKKHQIDWYCQPGNLESVYRLYPEDDSSCYLSYHLPQHQLALQFKPTDFIQVHGSINSQLIDKILEYLNLTGEETVLDLFCGVGNISLPLAKYAKTVVGVEGDKALTERAAANAQHNQLENVQFYEADLRQSQADSVWLQRKYDYCVIDPPRSGAIDIIRQLMTHHFKRIVYVSCNPSTLARDAGELVEQQGYQLSKAGVLDMFPHTAHVESIAVFEKP